MSENLLGFDTAAMEMQGVASLNNRCKDAVCHYELAWPPGERPTRPQWVDCALHTLKALGYEGHQFMIVAHDDKKHFHIHIMLNKVHLETLRAHTPYRDWFTLDAAVRFLEAKHGWAHTPGPMRWDEDTQQAVLQSKSERNASRSAQQHPTGAAAQFEHYQDQESFQSYVRREVAPRVHTLLTRRNVTWDDLHRLLSKAHLKLEKGESGGYTVLAVDYNIRVKASDVFRNNFAGKINRQATETALGAWTPASTSGYEADQQVAQHSVQHDARNSALREERKAQRHAERSSLMADYNQYRNQQRAVCKGLTAEGREARQHLMVSLRQRKKEIRASALSWPDKKVLLSQAAAQSVLEVRALKLSVQQRRQEAFPKNLRSWVADRADEGDARAAAQLRGWRYADQRNQRRLDARLESERAAYWLHLPRMTPAPIGPASRNNGLQPNRSNRLLPTRSPRPASGQSTARPATCRTHSTGKFPSSTADASSPFSTRIKPPSSSDWRWPSRNSDRESRVTAAWSGSGWSQRLRRNTASPSNSLTRRCNTPCTFFNVWRIRANASRKEAAGSS